MTTGQQFDRFFQQEFQQIGSTVLKEYKDVISAYHTHVIPFERNRLKENQKLVFKNSTLQKDKMELLRKVEQLTSENHRIQYAMQKQVDKIHELQRIVECYLKTTLDQQKIIEALKTVSAELQASLNLKIDIIRQVQLDKEKVLHNYQEKSNEYNTLLANYMKDKNLLAEKLNQMNQLEQVLLEKEKELKSQEFILKKHWEQIDQFKKESKITPQNIKSVIPDRPLKRTSIFKEQVEKNEQQIDKKKEKYQILKSPMKKIYKYHQNQIYALSFNYNGNLLASCGGDRTVKIFDVMNLRSGISISSNSAESIFISAALNYGGQRLLTGATDKTIQIYHTQSGKQLHSFLGHGDKVNSVAWSSSREKCISGGEDRQIKIWEIEKAANLLSISCGKAVKVITANNVEPVVYSGHSDGSLRIYSITQNTGPVSQIKGLIDYPIGAISLTSNRYQILASSLEGATIHLLDLKMNKSVAKYEHKDFFNTQVKADISPNENYVVAGNCDGAIYYWNRDDKRVQKRVSGHDGPVTTLKYHFMSGVMASADNQGNLILWQ